VVAVGWAQADREMLKQDQWLSIEPLVVAIKVAKRVEMVVFPVFFV
jgi:hypothetical protein